MKGGKEGMMNQLELQKRVAYLEFVNDQLSSEIEELDTLLRLIGFPNGLVSAKNVAQEMIDEQGLAE